MNQETSKARKKVEAKRHSLTEAILTVQRALSVKPNTLEVSRVVAGAN